MIEVITKKPTPVNVIRPASGVELTNYEKNKLAHIEEGAQQNKLEAIRINGVRLPVDTQTKTTNLKLGNLSFKSSVSPTDLSTDQIFFIKCSLE